MCSRHRSSLNGADSEYVLRPYVVWMGADEDEAKIKVRVSAAIGPRDAMGQARDTHPDWTPLGAEEVVLDYQEAEELRGRELA